MQAILPVGHQVAEAKGRMDALYAWWSKETPHIGIHNRGVAEELVKPTMSWLFAAYCNLKEEFERWASIYQKPAVRRSSWRS
jgi:hypothetical protein